MDRQRGLRHYNESGAALLNAQMKSTYWNGPELVAKAKRADLSRVR